MKYEVPEKRESASMEAKQHGAGFLRKAAKLAKGKSKGKMSKR